MNLATCPHCGKKPTSGRSLDQHRRLFGVIKTAFDNWPEAQEFQPYSAEHLRAWLVCKSGTRWREVQVIELWPDAPVQMVAMVVQGAMEAARKRGVFSFVEARANAVFVFTPKSIAFASMSHRDFNTLSADIDHVLTSVGFEPEQLSKEASREQPVCAPGPIEAEPEAASGSVPSSRRALPRLQEEAAAG